MRSQGHDKSYKVEVADKMLMKAERLDVEESGIHLLSDQDNRRSCWNY